MAPVRRQQPGQQRLPRISTTLPSSSQTLVIFLAFLFGLLLPSPWSFSLTPSSSSCLGCDGASKLRGEPRGGNGPLSFHRSEHHNNQYSYAMVIASNFGASVKMPDVQLLRHLSLEKIKNGKPHAPTRRELLEALYNIHSDGTDFYDGFVFPSDQAARFPTSKYGSNFVRDGSHVFTLIDSLMSSVSSLGGSGSVDFIVEAGSFVGNSAKVWAKFARKHNATVLCIDTWEGDVNMWVLRAFRKPMSVVRGRGHLYENFVQNIIEGGSTDVILPMAVSSLVGAKVLWAHRFAPDVAYIDTAHEQGETLGEMFAYWELLRPGGVLLGDDYNYFPAVKYDVDAFVAYVNQTLHFTTTGKTFAIQKPL